MENNKGISTEDMIKKGFILKCMKCGSEICREHKKGCNCYDIEGFEWYHRKRKYWGYALFG
jgi:hypothetical protein